MSLEDKFAIVVFWMEGQQPKWVAYAEYENTQNRTWNVLNGRIPGTFAQCGALYILNCRFSGHLSRLGRL